MRSPQHDSSAPAPQPGSTVDTPRETGPPTLHLLAAFAAVYLIWGSTYLAIRFVVEDLPPFLAAGARFLVAGAILYAFARTRGLPGPRRAEWKAGLLVGGLLLLGGNGGVMWAEQRVPSGLAALLVSTVPLWVVLLEWIGPERRRPRFLTLVGVGAGLAGVAILVGPSNLLGGGGVDLVGGLVLILASLSWAIGSVVSRRLALPASPRMATAVEMLAGGGLLLVAGIVAGEPGRLDLAGASAGSWLALTYLIVFGSLVGFSAYVYLLKVADTTKVATYAYVNPVVALILGWWLADEALALRTFLAAGVILGAVALITTVRGRRPGASLRQRADAKPPTEHPAEEVERFRTDHLEPTDDDRVLERIRR